MSQYLEFLQYALVLHYLYVYTILSFSHNVDHYYHNEGLALKKYEIAYANIQHLEN